MSLRALFLLLIFLLLVVFTILNWSAFVMPTTLSLVFATVQAPLGLIMLAVTAVLAALFLAYLVYLQTAAIVDARRTARALEELRDLADRAEASRLTELRTFLEAGVRKLESDIVEAQTRTGAQMEKLGGDLRSAFEGAANTLASYIGEIEDRIERHMSDGGAKSVD
jgi:uncharacterized integral membrane protein